MPHPPPRPRIQIEPWADTDEYLDLLRRNNAPDMTEHLGGPETEEQVLARHTRYAAMDDPAAGQMYRIVVLPDRDSVGGIGFWEREWQGESVYEIGWGVLPEFQGRGIATAAIGSTIAAARAVRKHRYVHAFPSVDNPASNAICRKAGFEFVAEYGFEYPPGNVIRCNDWRLDLTAKT